MSEKVPITAAGLNAAIPIPGIVVIDTCNPEAYGAGRIPGARWLEWYRMMKPPRAGPMFKSKDEILAECATIGVTPETPVYLYCFKGARASNTLVALKEAGIKDVRMYFGSWNEWSRDPKLPIESGLPFAPVLSEAAE